MIDLSSEPSLGSMVLTRDGVLKYSYILPRGMFFPADAEGWIRFTDRAGGEYDASPHYGELSADLTRINWVVQPELVNHVPSGSNFEVFLNVEDNIHKVRYGRIARKEVSYPLNPLSAEEPPALMYEDDLQRTIVGPRWVAKHGRVTMHTTPVTGGGTPDYGMAARNSIDIFGAGLSLWANAAVLWYAPMQSDIVEMTVGLCDGGDGDTTIVLCSNYTMTQFIGVRFHDPAGAGDDIRVVTGTAWDNLSNEGSAYSHIVPDAGSLYKITYSYLTNEVNVFIGTSTTPVITRTISVPVASGPGFRYTGAIWQGTLINTGPLLYYWKVRDSV
jgi:hypothetical protein